MMTLWDGPFLPLAALIWPLLLGGLVAMPVLRARALAVLPLAPLPALWLALSGMPVEVTRADDLLFGVVLGLEARGAAMLGMIAGLWLAAGIHAQGYMRAPRDAAVFAGFWCLTLAGNLGVVLARDLVTFYVAFAAVSLAAYFLVLHERTDRALRAGRVYIVLAVLGEAALLVAFTIGAAAADSLLIADMRAALPEAPLGALAIGLLVAGFGLKAGLIPLHVWLPLAHPAAPTPASAVLSGAIVKAGIVGLVLFVPPQIPVLATGLIWAGLASAFLGAALGFTQSGAKAVLAYSTISQMGVVIAVIGAGLAGAGQIEAALHYAVHHGLAKGALFLGVAVIAATGRRYLPAVLLMTGLVALSVAGAPLTGGALVKAAAKPGFGAAGALMLTLSAVATTLILLRFMLLVGPSHAEAPRARADWRMVLPWLALSGGALALPWLHWTGWSGALPTDYVLRAATLWEAAWPILLALALGAVAVRRRWRAPAIPEGDIVKPIEAALLRAISALQQLPRIVPAAADRPVPDIVPPPRKMLQHLAGWFEHAEATLTRGRVAGIVLLAAALLIALLAGH